MIRDIILACGCKVELTILPARTVDVFKDMPIQGVLTYPCEYHRPAVCVDYRVERTRIAGLN